MKTSEKILTFAAIFISCLALTVSIIQTRILQKQTQNAVWPRVDVLDSFGGDYYDLEVVNQGVGPAIIKGIQYEYQDTTINSILDLVKYLIKENNRIKGINNTSINIAYSSITPGRVIKPAESIEIFHAKDSISVQLAHDYFKDLNIIIDYCSIYESCWRLNDGVTRKSK